MKAIRNARFCMVVALGSFDDSGSGAILPGTAGKDAIRLGSPLPLFHFQWHSGGGSKFPR